MSSRELYENLTKYYDKIYSKKDYWREYEFIEVVIPHHQISRNVLLDGACETGGHV
ncbi:MAG: hypothetical protein KKF16_06915 [Euryarchaeota archaeon]|nr:hypothetical protein [Euryarchaeota archaeon]MBV1729062.1 hypothetical protein [Methanobacterium sp.]MBU4547570.1 hypothetical protein [Euryarchaeota archaeon]MBU4607000.1 hypothetical protein [Euryarchaeota archaeon]MBV1754821.1 hypothetical protein [Methanobacterium sp.]